MLSAPRCVRRLAWALRPRSIIPERKSARGNKAVNRAVPAAVSCGPAAWAANPRPAGSPRAQEEAAEGRGCGSAPAGALQGPRPRWGQSHGRGVCGSLGQRAGTAGPVMQSLPGQAASTWALRGLWVAGTALPSWQCRDQGPGGGGDTAEAQEAETGHPPPRSSGPDPQSECEPRLESLPARGLGGSWSWHDALAWRGGGPCDLGRGPDCRSSWGPQD